MCARISAGVLFLVLLQGQIFPHAVASSDHKRSAEYTRIRRETSSGGCQLPEQPKNGVYISPNCLAGDERSECRNLPGTTVPNNWLLKYSCSPNYSLSSKVEFSICNEGTWQNPLHCIGNSVNTTSCGLSSSSTDQGEYPWMAGIYYKGDGDRWEMRCGGTLISPHIVVTVASCVVSAVDNDVYAPDSIKIGLGKYYRDFYKQEVTSVIADVREIVVPKFYSGRAAFYALDIAILDLTKRVPVTSSIMPACVHWNSNNTNFFGSDGHVVGWSSGPTENETASDTLLPAELTSFHNAECINKVGGAFQRIVTHDKFCAEHKNGEDIDRAYIGSGMTYVEDGRHFLAGVESVKIVNTRLLFFTDIQNLEHIAWLEEHKTRLEQLHKDA